MTAAFLLDVNVLIALVDPAHVQHDAAHEWFALQGHKVWATCPLTEHGLLRIVGNARYPNSPGTPAAVVPLLATLRALPGHVFWPGTTSACWMPFDRRLVKDGPRGAPIRSSDRFGRSRPSVHLHAPRRFAFVE